MMNVTFFPRIQCHEIELYGINISHKKKKIDQLQNQSTITDDILSLIYNFLNFPELGRCALCCRAWKHLLFDRGFLGSFYNKVLTRAKLNEYIPLSVYIKSNNVAALVSKAQELYEWIKSHKVNILYIDSLLAKALDRPPEPHFSNMAIFLRAKLRVEFPETIPDTSLTDDAAFYMLDNVVNKSETPEPTRVEAQFLKACLTMKKRTELINEETALTLLDDTAANQSITAQLRAKARYYKAHMIAYNNIPGLTVVDHVVPLLDSVIIDNRALDETRAEARFTKANLKVRLDYPIMTNDQAFNLLDEVIKTQCALARIRAQAQLLKAALIVNEASTLLTDDEAFNLLDEVAKNQHVLAWNRAEAKFYKAILKIERRTMRLTDMEAFKLLDEVDKNLEAGLEYRLEAQFYKAYLKFFGRIERLTDDQAYNLLKNVEEMDTSAVSRRLAKYYLACMRVEKRVNSNDEDTFNFIQESVDNVEYPHEFRSRMQCLQVFLRAHQRTNRLTDAEAFDLVDRIEKEATFNDLRAKARYLKALLRVQNCAVPLTDDDAIDLLLEVAHSKKILRKTNSEARYLIALLKVQNRTERLTDEIAFNLLEDVINEPETSPSIRMDARYYRAFLRAENRIDSISDDEALDLLESVLRDRYASAETRVKALSCKRILLRRRRRNYTRSKLAGFEAISFLFSRN